MNILPVTVSGSGDRLKARLTDGSLVELPGAPVNMDWRELGVRPESLTVVSEGSETSATAGLALFVVVTAMTAAEHRIATTMVKAA